MAGLVVKPARPANLLGVTNRLVERVAGIGPLDELLDGHFGGYRCVEDVAAQSFYRIRIGRRHLRAASVGPAGLRSLDLRGDAERNHRQDHEQQQTH